PFIADLGLLHGRSSCWDSWASNAGASCLDRAQSVFDQIPSIFGHAQVERSTDYLCQATRRFLGRLHESRGKGDAFFSSPAFNYADQPNIVPFIASKVALPSSAAAVNLLDVLPKDLAELYSRPSAELLVQSSKPPNLSRKPRNCSHAEYIALLLRMHVLGMLSYTTDPKAVNDFFGVDKDNGLAIRF